jgi:hypothetical protein
MNLLALMAKVALMEVDVRSKHAEALGKIGELVEAQAKSEIGTYQPAVGHLPEWAPLAETTLDGYHQYPGKVKLGYAPPDNPLLRDGDMRDSIAHKVTGHTSVDIGSDEDKMVWAELGTKTEPPRSVLARAGIISTPEAAKIAAEVTLEALTGKAYKA